MRRKLTQKNFIVVLFFFFIVFISHSKKHKNESDELNGPNEWFYEQRSYPSENFDWTAYQHSIQSVQAEVNNHSNERTAATIGFNASWQLEGPGNIGGRINVVAVHPS